MPIYAKATTESFGEFFLKCGTKEIAGSISNTSKTGGVDASIVENYSWSGFANEDGERSFSLSITVPAFAPTVASAFNVLNGNDVIKELIINVTDKNSSSGMGASRNTLEKVYTAKNGHLVSSNLDEDANGNGSLSLHFVFEEVIFDNSVTNTTGHIKLTDGGY